MALAMLVSSLATLHGSHQASYIIILNNYLTSTYPARHTIYLNHHNML